MSESDAQLQRAISDNEDRLKYCGWVVVTGLVIEVLRATITVYRGRSAFLEIWTPVVVYVLVMLGVCGAIVFTSRITRAAEESRRRSEERVAAANRETEGLRAQFGWRMLNARQTLRGVDVLRTIVGATLQVEHMSGDPESQSLAHQIGEMFSLAGWSVLTRSAQYAGNVRFGVIVAPEFSAPPDLWTVVKLGLEAADCEFIVDYLPDWTSSAASGAAGPGEFIKIFVGPKRPVMRSA